LNDYLTPPYVDEANFIILSFADSVPDNGGTIIPLLLGVIGYEFLLIISLGLFFLKPSCKICDFSSY